MKPQTRKALSDPRRMRSRAAQMARLRALFAGQRLEHAFVLSGVGPRSSDDGPDWEGWLDDGLDTLAAEAEAMMDPDVFRPLCLTYDPRGVHFIDRFFGAQVFLLDGNWQARTLDTPVGALEAPDLHRHPSWQAVKRFTRAFLAREVPAVLLGMPTIASVLNIAVNLYGQRILIAMMCEPEAARHDLRVIHDTLCSIHRWYLQHVPAAQRQCIVPAGRCQPPGHGQLCGCTTQLLSPELYRDFIAPFDEAMLGLYPHGGMIHLCGRHTQHIPVWRRMKSLCAVQMNDRATCDLEAYFQGLRDDQILYVNPCPEMPVERILQITGGRRVVIVADLKGPLTRAPAGPPDVV